MAVKRATGARFLFDIRGFWADERVDGGMWPSGGRLYRSAKAVERRLFAAADHVVTLTHASAQEIKNFAWLPRTPPISVIPTCADLALFSPRARARSQAFTFGHVGSVGTWYLFDETLALFRALTARIPDARLLVVNRDEQDQVRARAERAGIRLDRLEITAGDHREMPEMISRMSVGAAIIKPVYSKLASAPTKLAEYLGCGVPCVGNIGVGDMEGILEGRQVGVALRGFAEADFGSEIERLMRLLDDPDLSGRCRRTAQELFSLDAGASAYDRAWRQLLNETPN
jgi:glycosyltransferase involved in cell wall biosynthesis